MDRHRFMTTLILLHTALAGRLHALRDSDERGSETTEKVLWISAVIAVVLLVYPILSGKLSSWFSGLNFGGM